jgi:hypothetical protein
LERSLNILAEDRAKILQTEGDLAAAAYDAAVAGQRRALQDAHDRNVAALARQRAEYEKQLRELEH